MASWKLTQDDRARLSSAILKYRFADIGVKLAAEEAALALKCYNKVFTKAERDQMQGLPKDWLPCVNGIRVKFAGRVESLDFSGRPHLTMFSSPKVEPISMPVPYAVINGVLLVVEATERLAISYEQHRQSYEKARDDMQNLSRQIEAVMSQATTAGKLVLLWPEVEPFLAAMRKPTPAAVPAVPIGALNKMLGLPVKDQASIQDAKGSSK